MLLELGLAVGMMVDRGVARPVVCSPAGVQKPPLYMVDSKGNCPKDSKPMGEREVGKGKKEPMYCVSTYKPKHSECKQGAPLPGTKGK